MFNFGTSSTNGPRGRGESNRRKKDISKRGFSSTSYSTRSSSTSSSSRRSLLTPLISLSLSGNDFESIKTDLLVMVQNNINKDNFFTHRHNSNTNRIIIEKRDDIYILVLSDGYPIRRKTFLILGDNCYIINILEKIQIVNLDIVFIHDAYIVDQINLFPSGFFTNNLIQEYENLVLNINNGERLNKNLPIINRRDRITIKGKEPQNQPPQIDYNQGYQEFIQYDTFLGRLLCIFSFIIIHNELYNRLPKNE